MVQELLDFKNKLDEILRVSFQQNEKFSNALRVGVLRASRVPSCNLTHVNRTPSKYL